MRLLLTGFGPFLDVADNPSSRLARALDGIDAGGVSITSLPELPVSYLRGPAETVARARLVDAQVVLGIGVARGAPVARVERYGRNRCAPELADVEGAQLSLLDPSDGAPDAVALSDAGVRLARALGVALSDDAGGYVCNAWAYRVARALGAEREVCFLHVPDAGLDPEALRAAIAEVWGAPGAADHRA